MKTLRMFSGWLLLVFSVIIFQKSLAQSGAWIPYNVDTLGRGDALFEAGDKCAVFTRSNSPYFLVYSNGEWKLIKLSKNQYFKYVATKGNIAFGWSDEILIAYNAVTGKTDTLSYEGNVIDDKRNTSDYTISYGCSENLAFFLTDKKLYVFDVDIDRWTTFDYGSAEKRDGGYYFVENDFIALAIPLGTGSERKNIFYSAHTKSFNLLEEGGIIYFTCESGVIFMTYHENGGFGIYKLIGYSALDNELDIEQYSYELDGPQVIFDLLTAFEVRRVGWEKLITTGYAFTKLVSDTTKNTTIYAYSTLLGNWFKFEYEYDYRIERFEIKMGGGKYLISLFSIWNQSGFKSHYKFLFFDATKGSFYWLNEEFKHDDALQVIPGGIAFSALNQEKMMGLNPLNKNGSSILPEYENYSKSISGEDFVKISGWSEGVDVMGLYFYNARTNRWSSVTVEENRNVGGDRSLYAYLYGTNPEKKVVLYSSLLDSIITVDFSDAAYAGYRLTNNLAIAYSDTKSLLINAENGAVFEQPIKMYEDGLGLSIAAFYDHNNNMLYGYSAVNNKWSKIKWDDKIERMYQSTGDNTVLMLGKVGSYLNKIIYAFNSTTSRWLSLEPEGYDEGIDVGKNLGIVVRSSHVYTYDPFKESIVDTLWDISGHVYGPSGNDPVNQGTVLLYKYDPNDHHTVVWQKDLAGTNAFSFEDIPEGFMTLKIIPSGTAYPDYLPAYLGDAAAWPLAAFFHHSRDTSGIAINLLNKPQVSLGTGEAEGLFKYGIPPGETPVFLYSGKGDIAAYDLTKEDGSFAFHNLPIGQYGFVADYIPYRMNDQNDSLTVTDENQRFLIEARTTSDYFISINISEIITALPDDKRNMAFTLYPNPAGDWLCVRFSEAVNCMLSFHIIELNGKIIKEMKCHSPGRAEFVLQIDDIPDGLYIVSVENGEKIYRQKMVKFDDR